MAGHFLLNNISQRELDHFRNLPGADWSGLFHAAGAQQGGYIFPGWTPISRAVLQDALSDRQAHTQVDRRNLPPHRYLTLYNHPGLQAALQNSPCVNDLCRPFAAWFGVVALNAEAMNYWNSRNRVMAVMEQANPNPVTLEIYHLNGAEMR